MLTYTAGNASEDERVVLQNPQPLAQLYVLSRFVTHPIVWSLRHKGNYIKNRPASHLEKQACRVDINLQVLNVNVYARRHRRMDGDEPFPKINAGRAG